MKVQVEILKKKDIRGMFIIAIDELYQYNTILSMCIGIAHKTTTSSTNLMYWLTLRKFIISESQYHGASVNFYQPAGLRLLYIFHICLFVCLFVCWSMSPTYHV